MRNLLRNLNRYFTPSSWCLLTPWLLHCKLFYLFLFQFSMINKISFIRNFNCSQICQRFAVWILDMLAVDDARVHSWNDLCYLCNCRGRSRSMVSRWLLLLSAFIVYQLLIVNSESPLSRSGFWLLNCIFIERRLLNCNLLFTRFRINW